MLGAFSHRTRERLTVSVASDATLPDESTKNPGILGLLLAMAMFVLVVDTSLMNVSISAVVKDLGTTASGVQSAIAIEALVSAAFILISSKVADLIGRRLGYVLGLLGYAVGALAMVLSQSLLPVVIFWSIFGGLGASLLLPSMQALIHGNFEGVAQKKVYALVGASSAIAAAIGPLIGGFVTTFLSWRVGFLLELVVIAVVLSGIRLVKDVPYTGDRRIDVVGGALSVLGMGGIVLGILAWEGGGGPVLLLMVIGAVGFASFAWWIVRRKRRGDPPLIDPDLFKAIQFRLGISGQTLQQIALGGSMIALPIFLQMVLEYNALQAGLSLMPLSLSMFAVAVLVGRRSGSLRRRSATIIQIGFALTAVGALSIIPFVPRIDSGLWLAPSLILMGMGLGLLVSQLNNYTLAPISEERISEAAGVNSAGGSFGLSFGLALGGALMLGALAFQFTSLANQSTVLSDSQKQEVATGLNQNAEVMSNTHLDAMIVNQPPEVEAEILRINTEARPFALQVALLVPFFSAVLGLGVSTLMTRQKDIVPAASLEEFALGG
jgi:MFS family permease